MSNITPGVRISLRGEDFLVTDSKKNIVDVEGISELVKGIKFTFDLDLEEYDVIAPENTTLIADTSPNYRQTKLFIETTLRNSSFFSDSIEIANKAAIRGANFQYEPTLKAMKLPKPRILIADGVGLGKTVEVGIFLAEMIRRGKGQRILVVTPKSILAQFQQEIWARFAIPLVRLDSEGIARIKSNIPVNKNPFDYYDKVIVSVDTLKNNAKFRHFLEKTHWDIVAIDECHTVANASSQRGNLAKFLSQRTESLVLTSATPHNGKKENFSNLMRLLDPTSIPFDGNFTHEDIAPLYVRRFKKDVEDEVGDAFRERKTEKIRCKLNLEEEEVLSILHQFKKKAYEEAGGDLNQGYLLFSIGLYKAYLSSPTACLESIKTRLGKERDNEYITNILKELSQIIEKIILLCKDTRYNQLKQKLYELNWQGRKKDTRIIIFAERRDTLNKLEEDLKKDFSMSDDAVIQFNGSLSDIQQQDIIEDFSKEDSDIRLFLSSDAGSQGVNLHYNCNTMFNYDLPWSIITLDQRNGRIDRFGQKNTPMIYYLIAESKNPEVQGDLRILEKLKEKEEEVHKSLGDAGSVWKLFEASDEEKKVMKGFAKSDPTELDVVEKKETDWLDLFELSVAAEPKTSYDKANIINGHSSFYKDDFSYYYTLVSEISSQEDQKSGRFMTDVSEKIIEVIKGKDLTADGVLFDIPDEAFPDKNDTFKLTTNKELVESAIENARKKKKEWPKFQLLYDLHPIARWMQFKILAKVDKGKALVIRLRDSIPGQSAWFVFQGISSNGKGKPIMSKSFVVGRSFDGKSIGNLESFNEFVIEYKLAETLQTIEIPVNHIEILQKMLKDVVLAAKKLYKFKIQGDLQDETENKLETYQKKLNNWVQDSERQLELHFGIEEKGILFLHKERRKREIKYLQDEMNKFYEEYFQLENEPYLRLLAVFYNA
jgi:ERCC4-related helicase